MNRRQNRGVLTFTAALAAGAVVCGVLGARDGMSTGDGAAALALLLPLVVAGSLQVSYQYKGHVDAFDLTEAVLMPVLFLVPGPGAIVIAVAGKLLSQLHLKVAGVKLAFNVAQWGCVAGVVSLVYLRLGTGRGDGRDLLALGAATAVGMVANHGAVATVISLASSRPLLVVVREMEGVIVRGWLLASGANLVFGTLFVALAAIAPAAAPLVTVPVLVLAWAQRAYSTAVADTARLAALQAATHELIGTVDARDALPSFLETVAARFESEAIELVLHDTGEVHHAGPAPSDPATARALADLVAVDGEVLRAGRNDPGPAGQLLRDAGRRSCIAVPLLQADALVEGVLLSFDHDGFDGSPAAEVAVLQALAGELASALHRSRLLEELVQEKHRVGEIVERSSDGIFTIGAEGEVESWNAAMSAITGYPPDAAVGRGLTSLRIKDSNGAPVVLERWADLDSLAGDLQILTARGEERWLACSYAATFDRRSLIVVARDVTQAREVERLKDDFVATVSHELRTPLTSIRGFATMLLDPEKPLSEAERHEALGMIRKGVRRLERLIFNLLEVSRIEARGTATATAAVDVVSACRRVVAEQLETARERSILLVTDGVDAWAHANEMSFEQIVGNLVSNAIKYAPTGPIEVNVSRSVKHVVVAVRDHGPGIPTQDHERIFERFERLDTPGAQAGTGLGLYIARQLATAMGGELTVSSVPGEGTTFELRLDARIDLTGDAAFIMESTGRSSW
jgi:PAS domain S-box-containing protein